MPIVKKQSRNRSFHEPVQEMTIRPRFLSKISQATDNSTRFRIRKPARQHLSQTDKPAEPERNVLTLEDYIWILQQDADMQNEFCYLRMGEHPYAWQIVHF